jgi:YD repeat-containing protein
MAKRILLLSISILMFLCSVQVSAQEEEPAVPEFNFVEIPPSPNAASLGRFGEIPVSKATGIPDISIPLFNFSQRGINVPISLSYHAGGIRVADEASWVGLGWALNAGGVITRVMRGKPDEREFLINSQKTPTRSGIQNSFSKDLINTYIFVNEISKGNIDFEPDQFYFNVNGHSGSFLFGIERRPVILPFKNVIIDYVKTTNDIVEFTITDENGLIYYFGGDGYTELTIPESTDHTYHAPFISAWYLRKIRNPFVNSEVNFYYDSNPLSFSSSYSSSAVWEETRFGSIRQISAESEQISTQTVNGLILSKIILDNIEIFFHATSARDGQGRFKLDSISVVESFTNELQRKVRFSFDYFNSGFGPSFNYDRLRLDGLEITGSSVNDSQSYQFEYSQIPLPPKDSKSIDHWGFFNGKNNQSRLPPVSVFGTTFGSADRKPDPEFTQAGILRKINYPTGGWTRFTYENNTYGKYPQPEDIADEKITRTIHSSGTWDGDEWSIIQFDQELLQLNLPDPRDNILIDSLSLFSDYGYLDLIIHADLIIPPDHGHPEPPSAIVEIIHNNSELALYSFLLNETNQTISKQIPNLDNILNYSLRLITFGNEEISASAYINYKRYDPRDLKNKIEVLGGGLRIREIESFDPQNNESNLKTYDYGLTGYLTNPGKISYSTITHNIRDIASGSIGLGGIDAFSFEFRQLMHLSTPAGGLGSSQNSVSYQKVTEYFGTPDVNMGKLETEFFFKMDNAIGGPLYLPKMSYQSIRSLPLKEVSFGARVNDNLIVYDTIQFVTYQNEINPSLSYKARGFKATRVYTDSRRNMLMDPGHFEFTHYTLHADNYQLKEKKTEVFSDEGDKTLSIERYSYDNPLHNYPTKIETVTSDGKSQVVELKYPFDFILHQNESCKDIYEQSLDSCNYVNEICYDDPEICEHTKCIQTVISAYNQCLVNYREYIVNQFLHSTDENVKAILQLALSNSVSQPIQKIITLDGLITEHTIWNYSFFKMGRPLLESVIRDFDGNGFTEEVRIDQYDFTGNIAQLTNAQGITSSYIWFYDNNYPTITASNLSLRDLQKAASLALNNVNYYSLESFFRASHLNSPDSREALQTFITALKANLPADAMIQVFTHKPHVGITSQTDTNGLTTYYEYDGLGRLIRVRDHEWKLVQEIDYHYANQ